MRINRISKNSYIVTVWMLLYMSFSVHIYAQNLIPNGSFEDTRDCPTGLSQFNLSNNWYTPNGGTPDLFSVCTAKGLSGIPSNGMGYQQAQHGKNYIGIITGDKVSDLMEYIQIKLKEPLRGGMSYQFSMYISLGDCSQHSSKSLDVHFSEWPIKSPRWEPLRVIPSVNLEVEGSLNDTTRWVHVTGIYLAEGGEQFLTIGNFNPEYNINTQFYIQRALRDILVYYFIDNVSLESLKGQETETAFGTRTHTSLGWMATSIYFDINKSEMMHKSISVLDSVIRYMQSRPATVLQLSGHADSKGDAVYNLLLSKARAKVIASYLFSKGIDTDRLRYDWFGVNQPAASNRTESGRRLNRRVELKIIQQ